jgi:hypothetical protein
MDRNIISKYGTKNEKHNGEENKQIFLKYNIDNIGRHKKEQSQVCKNE